jgi:alanyl-tRNA synthetase
VLLKNPADIVHAVEKLLDQNSALGKEMEKAGKERVRGYANSLPAQARANAKGMKMLVQQIDLDAQSLKDLGYALREQHSDLAFVAGSVIDGKPLLAVSLGKAFADATGLKAVDIIKQISPEIKGGGGGQPDFATAGGKEPGGLAAALKKAEALLA